MQTAATIISAYLVTGIFFAAVCLVLVWLTKRYPDKAKRIGFSAGLAEGASLLHTASFLVLIWPRLMWFLFCSFLLRLIQKQD